MEEYIQILLFAGAMIFTVILQSIKERKKPKTSPFPEGEILEEVFPNLAEAESIAKTEPLKKSAPQKKRQPSAKPVQPSSDIMSAPKKEKIRLSNCKEARRAFIYSEIFNRKY